MTSFPSLHFDRILVTGSGGFVGKNLLKVLQTAGHELILDWGSYAGHQRSGPSLSVSDESELTQKLKNAIDQNRIELIIHLAANTRAHDSQMDHSQLFAVNIGGTWSILEAARQSEMRPCIVQISSSKAYGIKSESIPDELGELRASSPYDLSKACADMLGQSYARIHNCAVGNARMVNLYGQNDLNFHRLIPMVILTALKGQAIELRSDGQLLRDYMHVDDAICGIIAYSNYLKSDSLAEAVLNFSTNSCYTILEIVEKILRFAEIDVKVLLGTQVDEERSPASLNSSLARKILEWKAQVSLDDGLKRTISWYKKHMNDRF